MEEDIVEATKILSSIGRKSSFRLKKVINIEGVALRNATGYEHLITKQNDVYNDGYTSCCSS